jgi:hypothetical protein
MAKQIQYPDIRFSHWVPWHSRNTLVERPDAFEKEASYPCLYILGRFGDVVPSPLKPACHTDRQVVYVGMSRNVRDRPIGAHTKQHQYKLRFHDPDLTNLYVAVFDIPRWGFGGELCPAQVAWLEYMERRLIWEYTDATGLKPDLNDIDPGRGRKRAKAVAKKKADEQAAKEAWTRKKEEVLAKRKAKRGGS